MHRSVVLGGVLAASLCAGAAGQQPAQPARPAAKITAPQPRQDPSQDELKQRRADKLAKEVFTKADWLTDFDAAKQQAAADDKLILVYFTRSYAP